MPVSEQGAGARDTADPRKDPLDDDRLQVREFLAQVRFIRPQSGAGEPREGGPVVAEISPRSTRPAVPSMKRVMASGVASAGSGASGMVIAPAIAAWPLARQRALVSSGICSRGTDTARSWSGPWRSRYRARRPSSSPGTGDLDREEPRSAPRVPLAAIERDYRTILASRAPARLARRGRARLPGRCPGSWKPRSRSQPGSTWALRRHGEPPG